MSERELLWLASRAQEFSDIVEFGSLHGRSTRALADNTVGRVWAVDPWGAEYLYEDGSKAPVNTYVMPYFCLNLKDHIDTGHVIPVRGFSYSFFLPHKVDMVFIDGDHRYETVIRDIKKAHELVRNNGLICGHDYGHTKWPGVERAVNELIGKVEVEDTIWWTLKS